MTFPKLQLNTGASIPSLGLGLWQVSKDDAASCVHHALKVGYRHLDTAFVYENEEQVGQGIKESIADETISSVDDVFVTTKLWNQFHGPWDTVRDAYRESLRMLDMETVDLYLVHWPVAFKYDPGNVFPLKEGKPEVVESDLVETWQAMSKLQKDGLCKAVGVSNFGPKQMQQCIDTPYGVMPAVNQIEAHPYCQRLEIRQFCKQNNIQVTAYSPLGGGEARSRLVKEPIIQQIAQKRKKTASQVLIAWCINNNMICIPKSSHLERIEENFNSAFALSREELDSINELNREEPTLKVDWCRIE
ncbi:hypothetical protein P9112_002931 [Eukaryota sp. TZLM1-RC]